MAGPSQPSLRKDLDHVCFSLRLACRLPSRSTPLQPSSTSPATVGGCSGRNRSLVGKSTSLAADAAGGIHACECGGEAVQFRPLRTSSCQLRPWTDRPHRRRQTTARIRAVPHRNAGSTCAATEP